MTRHELHQRLESLYRLFNDAQYIHPDPLEFVHRYDSPRDQELVGLLAATLAYGRVQQILKSVERVLEPMGRSPYQYIVNATPNQFERDLNGFQHRWTTSDHVVNLLIGMQDMLAESGTLEESFKTCILHDDESTVAPLGRWIDLLRADFPKNSLLSDPRRGSACKRLHLFLRWMVRKDAVDPGPWTSVSPATLVIPLDTHMFQVAKRFQMTRRKTADGKAALDMTRVFRRMEPNDPLKYDFVLTRLGIRSELSPDLINTL